MNQQVKKYFSIFLLFLFVFPLVEKEVHSFNHISDLHCFSSNKHLHPLEHNCSICDYTSTNSNANFLTQNKFILSVQNFSFEPFIESIAVQNAINNLPARAPPVV